MYRQRFSLHNLFIFAEANLAQKPILEEKKRVLLEKVNKIFHSNEKYQPC